MSTAPPAAPTSITTDDIAGFLAAKGATVACPSCSRNEWTAFAPASDGLAVLQMHKPDEGWRMPPPFVPAVMMICGHCGFVRIHAANAIAAWAAQQGGGSHG